MKIGVLALQGAFIEHKFILEELGCQVIELRNKNDLTAELDGIVLPGGESTVQGKLLQELKMFEGLKQMIQNGKPVLATCAGLILLADKIENDSAVHLGTLPVKVVRNAYGRQLGSFYTENDFSDSGKIPMTFIRAPYISEISPGVKVLSSVNGKITAVQYKNQMALSFHPELNTDRTVHKKFIEMCIAA